MQDKKLFAKRLAMTISGVVVCAVAVSMFNMAAFGVDPFQCFAQGLHIPFAGIASYGTVYAILSAVMLVAVFFLDKHYIGLATVINMFGYGYIVDFAYSILNGWFPDPSMTVRIVMILLAIVILCIGSALYFTGDLGVSVYDAIALSLSDKKLKVFGRILPFKFMRVLCDCICVVIGSCLGKLPGVGTIITAFFMGPLIDFFNVHLARPMLYGKKKKS